MKSLITIDDLDRWGACSRGPGESYSDETLETILDGRPGLTPLEVLYETGIPVCDKIWVMARSEVLGYPLYTQLGHACADRVVEKYALNCGVSQIESWARGWLDGVDRKLHTALRVIGGDYPNGSLSTAAVSAIDSAAYVAEGLCNTQGAMLLAARAAAGRAMDTEPPAGISVRVWISRSVILEHNWQVKKLIEMIEAAQ